LKQFEEHHLKVKGEQEVPYYEMSLEQKSLEIDEELKLKFQMT